MKDRNKVWYAGRASQEELDEIDRCGLCRILPELEQKCWAAAYCHRQMKMDIEGGLNSGTEPDTVLVMPAGDRRA